MNEEMKEYILGRLAETTKQGEIDLLLDVLYFGMNQPMPDLELAAQVMNG